MVGTQECRASMLTYSSTNRGLDAWTAHRTRRGHDRLAVPRGIYAAIAESTQLAAIAESTSARARSCAAGHPPPSTLTRAHESADSAVGGRRHRISEYASYVIWSRVSGPSARPRRRLCLSLVRLLLVLSCPPASLATRDPVRHRGGGTGDHGGTGNPSNKTRHRSVLSQCSSDADARGSCGLGSIQRGNNGICWDPPTGNKLTTPASQSRRERGRPQVLVDQDAGRAAGLQHRTRLVDVVAAQ
jgi:hypothetical protein